MADFYSILSLSHTAEGDAIAMAYRRSALALNPDCNANHPDPTSLYRKFKQVSQAYVVLADPVTRSIYDQFGEDGVRHGGTGAVGVPGGVNIDGIDPHVVFRRFFGVDNPFQVLGNVNGVQNNQHTFFSESAAIDKKPPKTDSVHASVLVTLEDVLHGSLRKVQWVNSHTSSRGEVTKSDANAEFTVPKGIRCGDSVTLKSQGNTADGRSKGDVVFTFQLASHERYRREGNNLVTVARIRLTEALCGTTVVIRTMDGRDVPVQIDEVVHPKFLRSIPGEGLPVFGDTTGKRGDLLVECTVDFPKYLTADQKAEIRRILDASQ